MQSDADTLLGGPLLTGIDRDLVMEMLHVGKRRSFAVLETLIAQGAAATSMHLILSGRVRVVRHAPSGSALVLAELGPGEGVGEIGLIDQRPRSATVVAIEPTVTLELHALAFTRLANSSSRFYELLARRLGERLRATDELLERRQQEISSLMTSAPSLPVGPAEVNKALVSRFRTCSAEGDWDGLAHVLAPGFTSDGLPGAQAMRAELGRIARTMADAKTTITHVIAERDWVVELTTLSGLDPAVGSPRSADQPVLGMPISRQVVFLYRIKDGRIAERIRVAAEPSGLDKIGIGSGS